MYHERKEDLSVLYFVEDLFDDVKSFTSIVDGFPEENSRSVRKPAIYDAAQ